MEPVLAMFPAYLVEDRVLHHLTVLSEVVLEGGWPVYIVGKQGILQIFVLHKLLIVILLETGKLIHQMESLQYLVTHVGSLVFCGLLILQLIVGGSSFLVNRRGATFLYGKIA